MKNTNLPLSLDASMAHQSHENLQAAATIKKMGSVDWRGVETELNSKGYSVISDLLSAQQCEDLVALYEEEGRFRSRIVMERYAFGRGEYKYFNYPLPDLVDQLRAEIYTHIAPIANRWHAAMRMGERFPSKHSDFIRICNASGQTRPTPLMLKYRRHDYCCLHQDLYGDHVFPIQAVFLLSASGEQFTGGELLLTEMDSKRGARAEVVQLQRGQAVLFPVNSRPVRGSRGFYRVNFRHGVSQVHTGNRHTLGIIFHDSR